VDRAKVMKEVRGWTLTILAVLAFRAFLYEAVTIPTGSMIPTLQIGDYVIVEKWAYNLRIPLTNAAQLTWATPKRGDIVVLLPPPKAHTTDDLIKRVVAVAGDKVEIRNGALVVNGTPVPREQIPGACTFWGKDKGSGEWMELECDDHVETLDGHRYHTYCAPAPAPCGDVPTEPIVPEGYVWLAGDHRDDSADSRVFGPVPVDRIKGRAWVALFSWGPGNWFRTDRFFHRVNH
jgi:signal peptidase I